MRLPTKEETELLRECNRRTREGFAEFAKAVGPRLRVMTEDFRKGLGDAERLELLEALHQPLTTPQHNPCKQCGRTSIFPVCGMCELLAKIRRESASASS